MSIQVNCLIVFLLVIIKKGDKHISPQGGEELLAF
jgi:hypothetical protein